MSKLLTACFFFTCFLAAGGATLTDIIEESVAGDIINSAVLAEKIKTWPGLKTIEGAAELFDSWASTELGYRRLASNFIRKRLEVPESQLVDLLLGRAQGASGDPIKWMCYVTYLRRYNDDLRVPTYLASMLDDKRRLPEKRGLDTIGTELRVCDIARYEIDHWLEKKGLIKFGDPGDASSALYDTLRDREIAAVKVLLLKAGILGKPKLPPSAKTEKP